jgi:hypothetical protein
MLANALKCLDGSIVVSEASSIDKLVARFITDAVDDRKKQVLYSVVLRGVVQALGQRHYGGERRFFVKFSCCSTAQLERIQRIWPDVPWVFLYREPVETIVSNLNTMPEWLVDPDRRVLSTITGVAIEEINLMSAEELCARSIGRFYFVAQRLANEKSLLLNYSQLSISTLLQVLQFFLVDPTPKEIEAIERTSQLYSKDIDISRSFVRDSEHKRNTASSLMNEMAQAWSNQSYGMLENKRHMIVAA